MSSSWHLKLNTVLPWPLLRFFWKEIKILTGVENHWYQEPLEVNFYLCSFLDSLFLLLAHFLLSVCSADQKSWALK